MRFKNNFTMVPFRNENPSHHSWLLSLREPTVSKDPFGYSSLVHLCCRAQCFFGFLCCTIQGNETKVQMGFTGVYEERPVIPRCWGSVRQGGKRAFYEKLGYHSFSTTAVFIPSSNASLVPAPNQALPSPSSHSKHLFPGLTDLISSEGAPDSASRAEPPASCIHRIKKLYHEILEKDLNVNGRGSLKNLNAANWRF